MSLLIYSNKCQHSKNILDFLNKNIQLKQVTRLHCVDTHGLPPQYSQHVRSVPTIITHKNQILVGKDCKNWLQSLLPPEEISHCTIGGGCGFGACSLDGNESTEGFFALDNYGVSLQPAMTPELEAKINKKVDGQIAYST